MTRLLVICGPTATGKTSIALKLAEKFNGELISADSRQIYRGMDIGTGKDIPESSKFQNTKPKLEIGNWKLGFYLIHGIKLWGYDLVKPNEEFSVAHYIKIAGIIIKDIHKRGKLPILVGGTGLYIKGVVDGINTAHIKPNLKVRLMEGKSAGELYVFLTHIDAERAIQLNESDKKNPRRLIRAIEIALSKVKDAKPKVNKFETLMIGLESERKLLNKRIEQRVFGRFRQGMMEEVNNLIKSGVSWNSPSMMATGYRQLRDYLENNISLDEAIGKWIKAEQQYAKRQMTWFKKDKRINWFDISNKDYLKNIEKLVHRWYS